MIHRTLLALLLLATALAAPASPIPTLTLTAADLTGAPGQTVGWGFTLDNPGTSFDLYVTNVWADGSLGSGVLGTFTDAIAIWSLPNGLMVTAGGLYTGSFPATALATFAIDASAEPGDWVSGIIHLDYDLYQGQDFQRGGSVEAPATVSVVAAAPVPATAALLALGLAGLAGRAWPRRGKRGA